MGNNPINGIDPDGGYKTRVGRFLGWVGGGFKGKMNFNNPNATNPYKKFGITTSSSGEGGVTYNISFGDWKADAISDIQADWRNAEFEKKYNDYL